MYSISWKNDQRFWKWSGLEYLNGNQVWKPLQSDAEEQGQGDAKSFGVLSVDSVIVLLHSLVVLAGLTAFIMMGNSPAGYCCMLYRHGTSTISPPWRARSGSIG